MPAKVPLREIHSRHAGFAAGLQQIDTKIARLEAELVQLRADRRATAGAVQAFAQLIEDVERPKESAAPPAAPQPLPQQRLPRHSPQGDGGLSPAPPLPAASVR